MSHRIWQFFYNTAWYLVAGCWFIFHRSHFIPHPAGRKALRDRLVFYPPFRCKERPVLWFHASSLGEVLTISPLMKKLRTHFAHSQILSVGTVRGAEVAPQSGADRVIYLPLDLDFLTDKAFRRNRPDLLVILETEIWPNLYREAARRNVPLILVSGRISARSFHRYRLAGPFLSGVLKSPIFLMQTEQDRQRLIAIGAPEKRVEVCGNIKLDGVKSELSEKDKGRLEIFPPSRPVIVAGSTHPGEEEALLASYRELRQTWPDLTLILAPRHLSRLGEVTAILNRDQVDYLLRSSLPSAKRPGVIVVDTYGELSKIYWLADVVFVGGTLAPVGGHNLAEPAALGKPLVIGPNFSTCKQQVDMLAAHDAICIVDTPQKLTATLRDLLSSPQKALAMGIGARKAVLANQGSLDKCISRIEEVLAFQ